MLSDRVSVYERHKRWGVKGVRPYTPRYLSVKRSLSHDHKYISFTLEEICNQQL